MPRDMRRLDAEVGSMLGLGTTWEWSDASMDTVCATEHQHDSHILDQVIEAFATQTNTVPESAYGMLVEWLAFQVRHPRTGHYLFQSGEVGDSADVGGVRGAKSSPAAETSNKKSGNRLFAPAVALFLLKFAYQPATADSLAEQIGEAEQFFCSLYGFSDHDYSKINPSAAAVKTLQAECQPGTESINGVLIPALRLLKTAQETGDKETAELLKFCLLRDACWYGMEVLSLLVEVTWKYRVGYEQILYRARRSFTNREVELLDRFVTKYFPSSNEPEVDDTDQLPRLPFNLGAAAAGKDNFFYPWARAVSSSYFDELADGAVIYLPVVWAFLLDFERKTNVWRSTTLNLIPRRVVEAAHSIAFSILSYIQGLRDDDALLLPANNHLECGKCGRAISRPDECLRLRKLKCKICDVSKTALVRIGQRRKICSYGQAHGKQVEGEAESDGEGMVSKRKA